MKAEAALVRRLRELDAESSREPRTHFFFRDFHQTNIDIEAEIAAARRSGRVKQGDRCVIFHWRSGDGDPAAS